MTTDAISAESNAAKKSEGLFAWLRRPNELAMFIGNLILALILGCLIGGMQVAFYAALVATPIWLIAVVYLGFQGVKPSNAMPHPSDIDD